MSSEPNRISQSEKEEVFLRVVEEDCAAVELVAQVPETPQPTSAASEEASEPAAPHVPTQNSAESCPSNATSTGHTESAAANTTRESWIEPFIPDQERHSAEYTFPYLMEPPRKTPHFDFKQFCNYLYFGAGILCVPIIVHSVRLPHAWRIYANYVMLEVVVLLACLTLLSCVHAFIRPKPSDFHITLSPLTRRALRFFALILPIPLFLAVPAITKSQAEYNEGQQLVEAKNYQDAKDHLNLAIAFNPFNEPALAELAKTCNRLFDYPSALAYADRALALRRRDAEALAHKAWALNRMDRYQEALVAAQRATRLDGNNGEAFASLADASYGLGNYEEALEASTRHLALHNSESYAYTLQADILEQLGRLDEAQAMRDRTPTF